MTDPQDPRPDPKETPFFKMASDAVARGLKVHPLLPRSKKPISELGWPESSTSDLGVIEKWAAENPDYNCGVVASRDGTMIVDVDDVEWFQGAWAKPWPKTFAVKTSKGIHYHFRHTDYSRERLPGCSKHVAQKMDVQLDRQYGIMAGSTHPSGSLYKVLNDSPLADVPDDVVDWVAEVTARKYETGGRSARLLKKGMDPGKLLSDRGLRFERAERDGHAYFFYHDSGGCRVKGAPHEGQRNDVCAFVFNPENREMWHKCFAGACDHIEGAFKVAMKALGYELADILESPKREIFIRYSESMAALPDESFDWLWPNVILRAALNLFVGLPDVGKSLVNCRMIMSVTTGDPFPLSTRRSRPGKVIVICKEDSYTKMWKPRLLGAGVDLSMVIPVHGVGVVGTDEEADWDLDNSEHLEALKKLILSMPDVAMVLIDPLADFVPSKNLDKAADVRSVMRPLNKVAQETNVAMVINCHTTKALVDSVIKTAAHSIQIMAAVQVSFYFVANPEVQGEILMLQGRNKTGKKRSFKYVIESHDWPDSLPPRELDGEEDDGVGVVVFKGRSKVTADEILQGAADRDTTKIARVKSWLTGLLSTGPKDAKECNQEAARRNFDRATVTEACFQLGVKRDGKWTLPASPDAPKPDAPKTAEIEFDKPAEEESPF